MYHSEVLTLGGKKETWKSTKKCLTLVGWKNLKATSNESQAALLLSADMLNCFHMGQSLLEILYQQRQLSLSTLTAAPLPWLQERAGGRCLCCWLGQGRSGVCRAVRQQRSPDVGQRTTRNERILKVIGWGTEDIHEVQCFTLSEHSNAGKQHWILMHHHSNTWL